MIPIERLSKIVQLVSEERLSTDQIGERLAISERTLRKDLQLLLEAGCLDRPNFKRKGWSLSRELSGWLDSTADEEQIRKVLEHFFDRNNASLWRLGHEAVKRMDDATYSKVIDSVVIQDRYLGFEE